MKSLDRGICRSSISLVTKLRLYNVYILPVLLYGSDTWSVTEASRRLDAFDQWCLRRILRIPYTAHVTNVSVRSQTDQPPVSSPIQQRRFKLFGHIARAAASEDHSRTCATSIHRSPPCWLALPKRPTSSVLASNNREQSQTDQPWTSLCITASIGSSFLTTHRGNGYALRACHQMMMTTTTTSGGFMIYKRGGQGRGAAGAERGWGVGKRCPLPTGKGLVRGDNPSPEFFLWFWISKWRL